MNQPVLTFWYHMNGAHMGAIHLDVYENSSWTDDVMPILIGNQGMLWKQAIVDLSAYTGKIINVRFRGETGSGERSDLAIDDIGLTETTGIEMDKLSLASKINIYPNPCEGIFNVSIRHCDDSDLSLKVYDVMGRQVFEQNINNISQEHKEVIDLSKVNPGVYYIKVSTGKASFHTKLSIF